MEDHIGSGIGGIARDGEIDGVDDAAVLNDERSGSGIDNENIVGVDKTVIVNNHCASMAAGESSDVYFHGVPARASVGNRQRGCSAAAFDQCIVKGAERTKHAAG